MFRWRRVGGTPFHVVISGLFTVLGGGVGLYILFRMISGVIIRGTLPESWPGMVFTLLFLAAWTFAAFRMGRAGLFVGDRGVRNSSFLRTQTIPWAEVKGFETRPMTKGYGSAFAEMLRAHAIWIVLKDSLAVQTSLVFRDKTSFLPAKGMTKLGDFTAGPMAAVGEKTGMAHSEKTAQLALTELRAAHTAAQKRGPGADGGAQTP
jgi:hypothetical protein